MWQYFVTAWVATDTILYCLFLLLCLIFNIDEVVYSAIDIYMPSLFLFILFKIAFGINHPHIFVKKKYNKKKDITVDAEKWDKYEEVCSFAQIM